MKSLHPCTDRSQASSTTAFNALFILFTRGHLNCRLQTRILENSQATTSTNVPDAFVSCTPMVVFRIPSFADHLRLRMPMRPPKLTTRWAKTCSGRSSDHEGDALLRLTKSCEYHAGRTKSAITCAFRDPCQGPKKYH